MDNQNPTDPQGQAPVVDPNTEQTVPEAPVPEAPVSETPVTEPTPVAPEPSMPDTGTGGGQGDQDQSGGAPVM